MKKKLILILFISCAVLTMIFLPIKKEENYIKIINNNIDDFKYKIGNDYFTGTYHYITISDVVDAVSSLEYS
ncbi:MAG: hypothetical protein IJD80_07065 [Oscillospiraceae bacterium]|nr:hypothetical protein [Oscillospiraceae bacterium]